MEGRSLRHYRILEKLGAGGMGEVYRGKDTRLGRDVAIKVLPEALAGNPDRLARFEREAQLLGALNDSHVGAIYGLERVEGLSFLVLELVEGETLAERIGRGPIPIDEVLRLGGQIAHGLEAAHAQGVIHRDLKPANVMVTPEGQVKLLDFGLARALAPHDSDAAGTHTPTMTEPLTQAGAVFGTAAYMSPEQVRGEEAGRPSDVWALGCVLFEMLVGKRAFARDTVADTMSAVLEHEPEWERLPEETPDLVRRLLRRCLAKDVSRRWRDVADVGLELEESRETDALAPVSATDRGGTRAHVRTLPWVISILALTISAALLSWIWLRPQPHSFSRARFELPPPRGVAVSGIGPAAVLAISPNGQHVAFVGHQPGSSTDRQLYLRSINELEARPVEGTSRATTPFFSPDGRWLGFHAEGLLKRVAITGGEPIPITEARSVRGASWGEDGSIIFAAAGPDRGEGIFRVSAEGGEVEVVVAPNPALPGYLRWPQHLPGAQAVVVSRWARLESERGMGVLRLDTGEYQEIRKGGNYPRYLSSGHLVYSRLGTLYAAPFDLERLTETAEPQPVTEIVHRYFGTGYAVFAVSESGSLVYQHDGTALLGDYELVWVDRQGSVTTAIDDRRAFAHSVALSPDNRYVAADVASSTEVYDLWIFDTETGRGDSVVRTGGRNFAPLWSPDGEWIAFSSLRGGSGGANVWRVRADGSGTPEQLTLDSAGDEAWSFSPDGQILLISRLVGSDRDILSIHPDEENPTPTPFLATDVLEWQPRFSPDGRWVAYASDEPGGRQLYVRPYPGPGARVPITAEGGSLPAWNPDGREIFYWAAGTLWAVPIETEPEFSVGQAQPLFDARPLGILDRFDVSDDGQRFLMVRDTGGEAIPLRLVYVPDFVAELEQNAAAPEN